MIIMMRLVVMAACLVWLVSGSMVGATKRGKENTIPEFFEDSLNIYALIVGMGIILLCVLIAFLIFKLKGRNAAFENSLFQNLEEEN
jgi:Na+/H+ antiporter NhaC